MEIHKEKSLISVCGESKIITQPDYMSIKIYISKVSPTIYESQKEVNNIVNGLLRILKDNKIENIRTTSIDIFPDYDWEDHKKIFLGQKVVQYIICKVYEINKNIDNVKNVLDKITINNNDICISINFGINDYNGKATEARDLSYKNAYEKAVRYANNAGLKIVKTIKISEFSPDDKSKQMWYSRVKSDDELDDDFLTELPIGNLEIGVKLFCDFLAE